MATRIDSEANIRQSVLRIYNKTREHFDTDREFDDYLEEVEDISN